MKILSSEDVQAALKYPDFIETLRETYGGEFTMPPRKVFLLGEGSHDAFAMLPSWTDKVIALKAFTYFPGNTAPYKSLYSKIMIFDREHGVPLALVDGTTVTFWRTAGISALASRFLSREDSDTLLVLGTGNLAPYLARAHASVRPLKRIRIWGRTPEKAQKVAADLDAELDGIGVTAVPEIEPACGEADIIVSATGSTEILVHGDWVKEGTHTDFLGNHHKDKRECDTALVTKARVFVDSRDNCFNEAGEILVPIEEGVFAQEDVVGELADLCRGDVPGRRGDREITLFKSVGTALGDLAGARVVFEAAG